MEYFSMKIFSFNGRIGISEYVVSLIICLLFVSLINFLMIHNLSRQDQLLKELLKTPYYYLIIAQGSKRCQDLGTNGWYQLIPLYIYFMLFKKGRYTN